MFTLPSVSPKYVKTVSDSVVVCGHTIQAQERIIKGLDDKVYETQPDIWEAVPRGHGIYTLEGAPVAQITGLRKFGYSDAPYGNKAIATHAVMIEKENGECAHVGGFKTKEGKAWWIAGSKHVHVAFPEECTDFAVIEAAYMAERYKYAIKIARVWHSMLSGLGTTKMRKLHNYVCESKATLCGEAILADSEHIVAYDQKDVLKFYAIADGRPSDQGLTACLPEEAFELFQACGLPTANMSRPYRIGTDEYKEALETVARRSNSEGVVVYGIHDGKVCAMWKEKSYPYVMERVVREAIINGKSIHAIKRRVKQRLDEHDATLRTHFVDWETKRFPWLLRFAVWLRHLGHIPTKNGWSVQSRWLTLQSQFAAAIAANPDLETMLENAATHTPAGPVVVVFVGLPGCGKSTTARGLYMMLKLAGANPRWLNQDEADCNRYKYFEGIKAAAADPDTTHILLDKSNLAPENRADYEKLGLAPTLTVVFTHGHGVEAYKAECLSRFLARGAAHRSLRSNGMDSVGADKFTEICDSMLSKFTEPTSGDVLTVDLRSWPDMILAEVATRLGVNGDTLAAIEFSKRYEKALAANPKKRVQYGGVSITAATKLLEVVPPVALEGKTVKREFHVTTHYMQGEMDPIWFVEQSERITANIEETIHVSEIVWDSHCVTARVTGRFTCMNAHPHITIAMDEKTKSAYSNDLLLTGVPLGSVKVDLTLTGKYFM